MTLGKRVRTVLCIFLPSILLLALFPFYFVYADNTATYYLVDGCVSPLLIVNNNYSSFNFSSEIRFCPLLDSRGYYIVCFVSDSPFTFNVNYNQPANNYSCPVSYTGNSSSSFSYNGNTYYIYTEQWNNVNSYVYEPIETVNSNYNNNNTPFKNRAVYLTYGDGAIDPEPEPPVITYGDLIIDGYSTDIAGNGSASEANIDHIKWNGYVDTNGNDISDFSVRLRIVPGSYFANTSSDLLLQQYDDFITNDLDSVDRIYNASIGQVSVPWSEVIDMLSNYLNRALIFSYTFNGDDWEKQGWIYQLRLENEDDEYIGNWQTVYSSTSSGVENDLNIINNNSISQEFITTLQEINNINNVENNWTVNNTEISVSNNYTEPSSGQKPWWAYLLESILNTFNITNNYINNGNEGTQNIVDTVNNSDDDLNDKLIDYHTYEDNFISDMEDNLSDIDVQSDLLEDNKFIASANWVAQQYTRLTNNNVIGSLIGFSLLLGLALIFIGKIR